ncbi:MAG: prolyl oligopeptidase family serine peptidase [Pseudomonadota bacterium]
MNRLVFPFVVFVLFFLSGCGGSDDEPRDQSPPRLTFEVIGSGSHFPSTVDLPSQDDLEITLVPNSGFSIDNASGCSGTLAGNTFTIPARSTSCSVSFLFTEDSIEDVSQLFVENTFTFDGFTFVYHLYSPPVAQGELYPLVFAAHGTAEGIVAEEGRIDNPHLIDRTGERIGRPLAAGWLQPSIREKYPSYVVAPLIPFGGITEQWYDDNLIRIFDSLIDDLIANHQIDPDRVHLTGHSAGGMMTWTAPFLLPETFASISPKAGWFDRGGEPPQNFPTRNIEDRSEIYEQTAIWSFQHRGDPERTQENLRPIKQLTDVGFDFRIYSEISSDESRLILSQTVAQPLIHIAFELEEPCESACHYMGADIAAREELYYLWTYNQRRLQNDRLRMSLIQRVNERLTLEYEVLEAKENDELLVWQKDQTEQWRLLAANSALENVLETTLLDDTSRPIEFIFQVVDINKRAYVRETFAFE